MRNQFITISTQFTIFSLRPYSTYRCTVAAVTVAQGPWSAIIIIQTYQDSMCTLCIYAFLYVLEHYAPIPAVQYSQLVIIT